MEDDQEVLKKFITDKIGLFGGWHVIDNFSSEDLRMLKSLSEECLFEIRQKEKENNGLHE